MSGRRSHPRFAVATPWDGAIRVLREIVVQRTDADELLAVSHLPAIVGEEMTLDVMATGTIVGLRVQVVESRPVMVAGSVRHRIRLALVKELVTTVEEPVPAAAPERSRAQVAPGSAAAAEAC